MKAKFIYETLNFERGLDPKKAMGIGSDYFWDNMKVGDVLECKRTFYLDFYHKFSTKPEKITKWSETYHPPIFKGEKIFIGIISIVDDPQDGNRERTLIQIQYDYIVKISDSTYNWMNDTLEKYKKYFNIIPKNE